LCLTQPTRMALIQRRLPMMRHRIIKHISVCLAGLAAFAVASPASSQQSGLSPSAQQLLLPRIQFGGTLEKYLENLRNDFFQVDADIDGQITQRDVDLHALMEGIQARTSAITTVMRYDLDGDGFVTDDEIRRGMSYDLRSLLGLAAFNKLSRQQLLSVDIAAKQIDSMVHMIMALDTDKDGKVSLAEAAKFGASGNQVRAQNGQSSRARQLLAMGDSSKGALSLAEYQAAGEMLFRKIDTDNDGTISQQELTDYRARAERAGCEMPAASEKAKVILLSSYQTEALSSVTLGSQDAVVHAGRVVVEPGSEPLYVVIGTFAPTIWQFSGAVDRVERVVLTSSVTGSGDGDANRRVPSVVSGGEAGKPPLAGATGIAQERVSFFSRPSCLNYFYETPTSASLQTVAAVRNAVGKAPETVAAKYSVSSFKVPSGEIEARNEKSPRGLIIQKTEGTLKLIGDASSVIIQAEPSRAKDEMYRFWPGGMIEIDPTTVVGSAPAARYEVLPAQAGLVQLLSSGALTQNSVGEYIVRQKIRFPAGLTGAHAVTFLIMKETPYPDGNPGHSCVIVEESGAKKGANCR
jgi:Ca2+-binding EF-hand superfamily protein